MKRYIHALAAVALLAAGCQQKAEMPTDGGENEVCGVTDDPRFHNNLTLDLDRDGKVDFYTEMTAIATTDYPSSAGSEGLSLNAMEGNGVLGSSEAVVPPTVARGVEIGPKPPASYLWSAFGSDLASRSWTLGRRDSLWSGPAVGADGRLFGVRVASGAGYKYGWLRLRVDPVRGILEVQEYAINSVPDAPIFAGVKP